MTFSRSEIAILKGLFIAQRPVSTNELAQLAGLEWHTIKNNVPRLVMKGIISEVKQDTRSFWKLNEEVFKHI